MRLAIDAKWYFNGPPSGKNVVKNIVDNFISNNYDCKIFLILDKKDFSSNTWFKQRLDENQVKYILVNSSINFLSNLFLINKNLVKNKIDIALLQNYIPVFKSKKIIYVNYIHDFLFVDYPYFFTKAERFIYNFIKLSALKSNHIITISNSEKNRIKKHLSLSESKISFVYHGIDESFKKISTKLKSKTVKKFKLPEKYILYVGRVNIRKNLNVLLDAVKVNANNNYKIVIVGATENDDGFIKKTKKNSQNNIMFLGHVSQQDLSLIMASATVFVFPSKAEGFGLPPIEAMKCGVPVIVSNTEVHNEICQDSAVFFETNSPIDLASKIKILLNNKSIYNNYICRGLKRSQYFQWTKSVEKIYKILNKLHVDSKNC